LADPITPASNSLFVSQVLAELGPVLTGERDLERTAAGALSIVMPTVGAGSGAVFRFSEKPDLLASVAARGFRVFPHSLIFPLLPQDVGQLLEAPGPQRIGRENVGLFPSVTGNVSGAWFRCIAPLKVRGKLIGALLLGEREGGAEYTAEILSYIGDIAPFIALAVYNHQFANWLEDATRENLRLIASVHACWDEALAGFAATIDAKGAEMQGHSLRVGRYSAGLAAALGMSATEVKEIRAAGYLHDIGKVTVDNHIFSKAAALEPVEFQAMANHTVVGHRIVSRVHFPWPHIPEVVRSHHERADGSGYPDNLRNDEVSMPVRIVAVADMFDAMLNDRPYRKRHSLAETAAELSRLAPTKLDIEVVHALLVQLRRDAAALLSPPRPWAAVQEEIRRPFLDPGVPCNVSPADIDHLLAEVNHRAHFGRVYLS
jgi:putative nucleotidyltransferase with HDIG domain